MTPSTTIAPSVAPTPIPALAGPLKLGDVSEAEDDDACEVVSVAASVFEVLLAGVEFLGAEVDVVRRNEVALDSSRVALLLDEPMLATGVPTESSRNLPTPVSQQLLVP